MGKAKTENNKNSKVKEVHLDKELKPLLCNDKSQFAFVITFFYDENEEDLTSISFTTVYNDSIFELDKKIIDRYSSFKRADSKTMEVMRMSALRPNGILALKKYSYECIQYIN